MSADLRRLWKGRWCLLRVIADRRANERGTMLGWARFTPDGACLLYREAGWLAFGGARCWASRAYVYRLRGPWAADVTFESGEPFHELSLADGSAEVSHACGSDLYLGTYTLLGDGAWRLDWQVRGPRKDLALNSHYLRYTETPLL